MRNIKIKALFAVIMFTFAVFFTDFSYIPASAAFTPEGDIKSTGYYMVNLDLGTVVAAKNENVRCYPASITKVMTAIVAIENCSDLDRTVEVTYDATNEFWEGDPNKDGAGTCGIAVGQTNLTMRDCLYGLLVKSGCEAGNVIALNICDSIADFVNLMNKKAAEIGCKDTHFGNTHGLWQADNYSTPYDLYLIGRYAYDKVPQLIEIANTQEYVMPENKYNPTPYTLVNVNSMIRNIGDNPYYYEYAQNVKTGSLDVYWDEAGVEHPGFMNMISTATQNGFNYMLVTVGAPYTNPDGNRSNYHFTDAITLYKWAFKNLGIVEVISEHTVVANIKVDMGENADVVILKPSASFSTLLPKGMDTSVIKQDVTITAEKNDNDAVVAPIEKGQVLGTLELSLNDEVIWHTNLIASQNIELSQFEYTMRMINSIFDKGWFKLCIVLLAVFIIADVILNAVQKNRIAKLEARQRRKANINRKW